MTTQSLEEYLYKRVFGHVRGIFIDIGAGDGITHNNTIFFESQLRWTGICCEPHPQLYQRLLTNRRSLNIRTAVSNIMNKEHGFLCNTEDTGCAELSGIPETIPLEKWTYMRDRLLGGGKFSTIINVTCIPLPDICEKHGVIRIDYLSIDTMGHAHKILEGIYHQPDWDNINPKGTSPIIAKSPKIHINVLSIPVYEETKEVRQLLEKNEFQRFPETVISTNGTEYAIWQNNNLQFSWDAEL